MSSLEDTVTLVTGGTTGIGLATASAIVAAGGHVMVAARNSDRVPVSLHGAGEAGLAFRQTDVSDELAVVALVDETVERFGHIDFLFNNAGVEGTVGPMSAWSSEDVDAVLTVNVKGAFLCMKHVAPRLAAGGVIVNTASLLATIPMPLAAPYAASKAALLSLTRSVAAELAGQGISAVAVCPGVVDTPMMDRVAHAAGAPKDALAEMVCPSGRVMSAGAVADVVVSLLAGERAFTSGSALRVGPDQVVPIVGPGAM